MKLCLIKFLSSFSFLIVVELGRDEKILWERKGNLKIRYAKVAGTLFITNKKIAFEPFLAKNAIILNMGDIQDVKTVKKINKKLKIVAKGKEYIFSVKHPENIARLIKSLIAQYPQDL